MGAALRPGPAPGICGAPDPPRPASLRGGARLALRRCLPPRPLAQLCPNLPLLLSDFHPRPPLPPRQFGSCAPPTCRTLQPREQPRAEALPDGGASAGRGAAQDEGGRAEGPGRRQTPLLRRTPQAATHASGTHVRGDFPVGPPRAASLPPSTCARGRMEGDPERRPSPVPTSGPRASARGCFAVGGQARLSDANGGDRSHLPSLGHGFQSLKTRVFTRCSPMPLLNCAS